MVGAGLVMGAEEGRVPGRGGEGGGKEGNHEGRRMRGRRDKWREGGGMENEAEG